MTYILLSVLEVLSLNLLLCEEAYLLKRVKIYSANQRLYGQLSLRSWRDFARECFCCSSEAVNTSGETVRGLVKSRVEFPPAQIRWVF